MFLNFFKIPDKWLLHTMQYEIIQAIVWMYYKELLI